MAQILLLISKEYVLVLAKYALKEVSTQQVLTIIYLGTIYYTKGNCEYDCEKVSEFTPNIYADNTQIYY